MLSIGLYLWAAPQLWAQTNAPKANNKPLEFIISTGAGAGYDSYARILARTMPSYLPDHPQIIIRHMDGAGGLTATNYIATLAPPVVAHHSPSSIIPSLICRSWEKPKPITTAKH